jgi:hypothetical protein
MNKDIPEFLKTCPFCKNQNKIIKNIDPNIPMFIIRCTQIDHKHDITINNNFEIDYISLTYQNHRVSYYAEDNYYFEIRDLSDRDCIYQADIKLSFELFQSIYGKDISAILESLPILELFN